MTSPIDPIRRAAGPRRKGKAVEEAKASSAAGLPVPVDAPRTVPPAAAIPPGAATFDAQLLGQHNERRGLRGGPAVIDKAQASYNRIEWSGSKDRRARKGGQAKTDV
ncbi:MAG TPA: hypothetical protein VJS38_00655 [Phenylobacterium sp.]|uniref:hypothetical protein n=1 Tax=Phenylobacterium sp. TaxID=1871053 RepID=UPI002B48B8B2|nr:hypothetical protein [Phenylobacterium sp.]HKR86662.1 hypothetical protein [Phenylobacterium sp.]